MRKVFTVFLLLSYINGYFCCSIKNINGDNNLDKESKEDIMVVTKDSTR